MNAIPKIGEYQTKLQPLYGLAEFNKRPDASVVVVGDEKCLEAAKRVFPSAVVVTSPGGSNAAMQADWTPLAGRSRVLIWPDLDAPGFKYATTVADLLAELGIPIVLIVDAQRLGEVEPSGSRRDAITGWNVADAVSEGHDLGKLRALALEVAQFHKPTGGLPGSKLIRAEAQPEDEDGLDAVLAVIPLGVGLLRDEPATPPVVTTYPVVKRSRRYLAPVLLMAAALALGAVGIAINGWFARSMGSSYVAGWLFLAVGVAADLVALVMPSCAAGLWRRTNGRPRWLVGRFGSWRSSSPSQRALALLPRTSAT